MNWSYILFLSTQSEEKIITEIKENIEAYFAGDKQENLETILREGFEAVSISRNGRSEKEEK